MIDHLPPPQAESRVAREIRRISAILANRGGALVGSDFGMGAQLSENFGVFRVLDLECREKQSETYCQ